MKLVAARVDREEESREFTWDLTGANLWLQFGRPGLEPEDGTADLSFKNVREFVDSCLLMAYDATPSIDGTLILGEVMASISEPWILYPYKDSYALLGCRIDFDDLGISLGSTHVLEIGESLFDTPGQMEAEARGMAAGLLDVPTVLPDQFEELVQEIVRTVRTTWLDLSVVERRRVTFRAGDVTIDGRDSSYPDAKGVTTRSLGATPAGEAVADMLCGDVPDRVIGVLSQVIDGQWTPGRRP